MRWIPPPDALFSLVGLEKLTPETLGCLLESRRRTNSGTLRIVAGVAALVVLVQLVLTLNDPKVPPGSPLAAAYLAFFLMGFLASAFFFVFWTLAPRRRGYLLYVRILLILGVGLTLCDLQLSGDFSTFTLILMGTSLLYSARLPWYILDFGLAWGLLLGGMALFPPAQIGTNPAAATAVLTVVGIAAGIILEARRVKTELLTLELGRKNQELQEASVRDALTGLYNRRFLFEWLDKQIPLVRRVGQPLAVALIDLDHFKEVNDTAGHHTGDVVLKTAARWLEGALRKSDVVGRYGGEEFLLVLPDTGLDQANLVLDRCLQGFRAGRAEGWSKPVTFSAGLTVLGPGDTVNDLFQRADSLLYQAKAAGRNLVRTG